MDNIVRGGKGRSWCAWYYRREEMDRGVILRGHDVYFLFCCEEQGSPKPRPSI
jgi:hypothetical protein